MSILVYCKNGKLYIGSNITFFKHIWNSKYMISGMWNMICEKSMNHAGSIWRQHEKPEVERMILFKVNNLKEIVEYSSSIKLNTK